MRIQGRLHHMWCASATLLLSLAVVLASVSPATAATTVHLSTDTRTRDELATRWRQLRPVFEGSPYAVMPSASAPYATGSLVSAFLADGLNTLNFMRYAAGVPDNVALDSSLTRTDQHAAVLLAASDFSHTPARPADMPLDFYDTGVAGTLASNIGWGYSTLADFNRDCADEAHASTIARVGHRRWLLNPAMAKTGMGYANGRAATYAFDRSRSGAFGGDAVLWPAAGDAPVEFFGAYTPWSVTLNPERFTASPTPSAYSVTLRRISDGRAWSFDASDTDTGGEFFNADFSNFGYPNAFVFRPDPTSITAYSHGDEFEIVLSGPITQRSTGLRVDVTYRTRFVNLGVPMISVAGASRYDTAIAASRRAFPNGSDSVVIATGANWPDALGGSALAGAVDSPLLLTTPSSLPGGVANEVARLGARKAYVLGGTGAVSGAVLRGLEAIVGAGNVERLAGADRYDTAARVADRAIDISAEEYGGGVFVATGANFPDALGASPIAAATVRPIVLVRPGAEPRLPAGAKDAVVLGGTAAVSSSAQSSLEEQLGAGNVSRLGGADRYATAAKVAEYGHAQGLAWDGVGICTGAEFPDAMSGGAMLGRLGSVMVLTPTYSLCDTARACLIEHRDSIDQVHVIGGTGAVSTHVRDQIAEAVTN